MSTIVISERSPYLSHPSSSQISDNSLTESQFLKEVVPENPGAYFYGTEFKFMVIKYRDGTIAWLRLNEPFGTFQSACKAQTTTLLKKNCSFPIRPVVIHSYSKNCTKEAIEKIVSLSQKLIQKCPSFIAQQAIPSEIEKGIFFHTISCYQPEMNLSHFKRYPLLNKIDILAKLATAIYQLHAQEKQCHLRMSLDTILLEKTHSSAYKIRIFDLSSCLEIGSDFLVDESNSDLLAPEVLWAEHNRTQLKAQASLDGWTFGIILLQLLLPEEEVYIPPKVIEYKNAIDLLIKKIGMSHPALLELISRLLKTNPNERLSCFSTIAWMVQKYKMEIEQRLIEPGKYSRESYIFIKEKKSSLSNIYAAQGDIGNIGYWSATLFKSLDGLAPIIQLSSRDKKAEIVAERSILNKLKVKSIPFIFYWSEFNEEEENCYKGVCAYHPEYASIGTLRHFMERKGQVTLLLEKERYALLTIRILRHIAHALGHLHNIDLCYLNLSIEHILLQNRPDGQLEARLHSFGRVQKRGSQLSEIYQMLFSMAPEWASNEAPRIAHPSLDAWSFGILSLTLLTGKSVDSQADIDQLLYQIENEYHALYPLIKKLLDPDPVIRPLFNSIDTALLVELDRLTKKTTQEAIEENIRSSTNYRSKKITGLLYSIYSLQNGNLHYIAEKKIGMGATRIAKLLTPINGDGPSQVLTSIQKEYKDDKLLIQEMQKEAEIADLLHMELKLISKYDKSLDRWRYHTVAPYYDLGSLEKFFKNQNRAEIGNMMLQVAEQLEELHNKTEYCHLDLSLGNIVFNHDYKVRLIDLASAKKVGETIFEQVSTFPAPELTMAVEQNQTIKAAHSLDVWSFGIIFLIFLDKTNSNFGRDMNYCAAKNKMQFDYDLSLRIANVEGQYPISVASFIKELLQSEPEKRPSFSDIKNTFEQFIADEISF
ncbi:MAG: protein kinase [Chlamydia sp.]